MPQIRCELCKYSQIEEDVLAKSVPVSEWPEDVSRIVWTCRRRAPRSRLVRRSFMPNEDIKELRGHWPTVRATDWCAEFERRGIE